MTSTYQAAALAIAAASALRALSAWDRGLPPATTAAIIGTGIALHNEMAASLADAALASTIERRTGRPTPSLGLRRPAGDEARLRDAAQQIATQGDAPGEAPARARIERLATAEPLDAGRAATAQGMEQRGIPGWTRRARPNACELCRSLADGSVFPASKTMYAHPGCGCVAEPVLTAPKAKRPHRYNPNAAEHPGLQHVSVGPAGIFSTEIVIGHHGTPTGTPGRRPK